MDQNEVEWFTNANAVMSREGCAKKRLLAAATLLAQVTKSPHIGNAQQIWARVRRDMTGSESEPIDVAAVSDRVEWLSMNDILLVKDDIELLSVYERMSGSLPRACQSLE